MYDPIADLLFGPVNRLGVLEILLRLGLSIFLSAIIGFERSGKRHAAGLRTFIIVSLGGTVATVFDIYMITSLGLGFPFASAAAQRSRHCSGVGVMGFSRSRL